MTTKILALLLCFSLAGLPACARNYLYQPSVIKRSMTAEGIIAISDAHILSFADDVKLAWQKRTQVARGIELAAEGAEAGLGALGALSTIVSIAFPVIGLVSMVSGYIGKLIGAINPDAREGAYLDGINLIDNAVSEYFAASSTAIGDTKISNDKRTKAGEILYNRVNAAIYKVEAVLSGRVPAETPLAVSPPPTSLKGLYSIDPAPAK